jgi:hypothetical protein
MENGVGAPKVKIYVLTVFDLYLTLFTVGLVAGGSMDFRVFHADLCDDLSLTVSRMMKKRQGRWNDNGF